MTAPVVVPAVECEEDGGGDHCMGGGTHLWLGTRGECDGSLITGGGVQGAVAPRSSGSRTVAKGDSFDRSSCFWKHNMAGSPLQSSKPGRVRFAALD